MVVSLVMQAPGSAGFVGCVRDVKLNEEPLGAPTRSVGVVPCFQGAQQPGLYISSQGGHVSVGELTLRKAAWKGPLWPGARSEAGSGGKIRSEDPYAILFWRMFR